MFHTYMAPMDISTKSLQKGSAEFLVLSILDGPDRHGYELAQIIETRSGGKLSFKAATLYPLLYKLEKQGWVSGRWVEKAGERRRRFYRLTAERPQGARRAAPRLARVRRGARSGHEDPAGVMADHGLASLRPSQLPPLAVSAEREIEIVEELAVQLESIYERARARGATDDEARAARDRRSARLGGLRAHVGKIERPYIQPPAAGAGSGGFMTGFIQDIRYALRALKRAPGFAAVSILTLALGIGATTIVYSIVDGILLRPLPIADPDRVMLARETVTDARTWHRRGRTSSTGRRARPRSNIRRLARPDREPHRHRPAAAPHVRQVTWNLLSALGVKVAVGRDFTADDDKWGVERTAIVSYAFWQRELGGSADGDRPPHHARRIARHGDRRAAAEDSPSPARKTCSSRSATYVDPNNAGCHAGAAITSASRRSAA